MSEYWLYPDDTPATNVFTSHPAYDEAFGPFRPDGDRFIPIDEVAAEEATLCDESEEEEPDED